MPHQTHQQVERHPFYSFSFVCFLIPRSFQTLRQVTSSLISERCVFLKWWRLHVAFYSHAIPSVGACHVKSQWKKSHIHIIHTCRLASIKRILCQVTWVGITTAEQIFCKEKHKGFNITALKICWISDHSQSNGEKEPIRKLNYKSLTYTHLVKTGTNR